MDFFSVTLEGELGDLTEERVMDRISLEADALANVSGVLRNVFPSIVRHFQASSSKTEKLKFKGPQLSHMDKMLRTLDKTGAKDRFLSYRKTLVPVPDGFTGDFLSYSEYFVQAAPEQAKFTTDILREYTLVLSNFISNQEARRSLEDHDVLYARVEHFRTTLRTSLQAFFSGDQGERARLIQVVPRYADLRPIVDNMVRLNNIAETPFLRTLDKSMLECAKLLSIIQKRLQSGDFDDVSGEAAKRLANGAYKIANFVDTLVVFYYGIQGLVSSVEATLEVLTELENKK